MHAESSKPLLGDKGTVRPQMQLTLPTCCESLHLAALAFELSCSGATLPPPVTCCYLLLPVT